MSLIELKDVKPSPDKYFDYPESLKSSGIPLVIDNGKYFSE